MKFGTKTIEVATFRRNVRVEAEEEKAEALLAEQRAEADGNVAGVDESNGNHAGNGSPARTLSAKEAAQAARDLLIQRDNTYGTPEEDAFRRDFTINGLFYDAAAKTVIDYVGGLDDLRAGLVRSIGDPLERFQEDPVRMLRAVVMADRLGFKMDGPIINAIETLGPHIRQAAPARLLEEYYKILRSGAGERVFQGLARNGLIEHISPEMEEGLSAEFFESLARLDAYRARFESAPDTLTNTILLGSLLVPLGLMEGASRRYGVSHQWYPALGRLPIPKKDVERLQHLLALQPRLLDLDSPPRTQQALMHRGVFREALTWLEIYGDHADAVQHWHTLLSDPTPSLHPHAAQPEGFDPDQRRRRRRRRRRPYNSLQP